MKNLDKRRYNPYELFLKTLYEYFKEEINEDKNEIWEDTLPDDFYGYNTRLMR